MTRRLWLRRPLRHGVVLFIVTIVIALVSLSAYAFAILMQTEYRAASLRGDQLQAEQVAASGTDYLRALLSHSHTERNEWGGWYDNPAVFRDQLVDLDPLIARAGRFSILTAKYNTSEDTQPEYYFGVEDTANKLSLETLLLWDQQSPGSGRAALMQLPGMDESTADAILDWIDPDDEEREFGAESEFYQELEPARLPANALPVVLDQLLAVRGVTPQLLLGIEPYAAEEDTAFGENRSGMRNTPSSTASRYPASMSGQMSARGLPQAPWCHFLTVYSAERNETRDGQPRINLNSSDLSELQGQLSEVFDESVVNFVVALRRYGPASSASRAAASGPLPPIDLSEDAAYRFTSPLDIVDAQVAIPDPEAEDRTDDSSEPRTVLYRSPFSTEQRSLREEFLDFCDRTTTDSEPRRTGRINLQGAPREVLRGIPGFSAELVDQVISSREPDGQDSESQIHPAWLLVEGIVDLPTMKQLLPWLNTGGDVIRAEIISYYDRDSPWTRQETMLDGTREGVPAIYYKDLRRMGRGFRWEQLARESSLPDASTPSSPVDNLTGPYSIQQTTSNSARMP